MSKKVGYDVHKIWRKNVPEDCVEEAVSRSKIALSAEQQVTVQGMHVGSSQNHKKCHGNQVESKERKCSGLYEKQERRENVEFLVSSLT